MLAIARTAMPVRLVLAALAILVSGCAVQLAPPYDKAVADGLATVNTDTMTLLASISAGTKSGTYSKREDKYNALIGRVEALALQAGARPMPKNKVTDAIRKSLNERGGKPLADDADTPPSAHAITMVAKTLTKIRDTDKKQGVTALEVKGFKGQIVIYLDQAITYENFLQR